MKTNTTTEPQGQTTALRCDALVSPSGLTLAGSYDYLMVIADPECYETRAIPGRDIMAAWTEAMFWPPEDVPTDEWNKYRDFADDIDNWHMHDDKPTTLAWDFGEGGGRITLHRLTANK